MKDAVERDEEYDVRPDGGLDVGIEETLELDAAVIVALGCNDKGVWASCREALEAALARFRSEGIDVVARSSWWSSRAWPDPEDPTFLNGAVIVRTDHDPHELMAALGRIEEVFGRERSVRNAPRTLDLDLIAYGRLSGDLDGLILPHPRAAERKFVMGPIAEMAPAWVHPHGGEAGVLAAAALVGTDAHPV
ncbi:2-amino-4-hydroxy-6-hydroxymethyldihydropteridine diphosphokinase [Brevundimonas sp.]|jgi:2-amino-4-hydroxy-6-hydroxymethyldihydropteridine diphosphokinase|uniref:2-amino-4-hydroxy-6- hydroxymethyldihydropteridine diphosphokinase n=1 Tax=Brevundimonas sp. TaxID=1871086 RepID=UPI0017AB1DEE|nr:2-amino-4-hydroxy-6-hydroxymethyldihydropteridine diphosphokinase [Brevundimonas sp.]MBA4806063.1 2-amino-4-hydroxy-6-hydroxymethyldihydropteridine diphosphokinase [Brevundimonas sp.]